MRPLLQHNSSGGEREQKLLGTFINNGPAAFLDVHSKYASMVGGLRELIWIQRAVWPDFQLCEVRIVNLSTGAVENFHLVDDG